MSIPKIAGPVQTEASSPAGEPGGADEGPRQSARSRQRSRAEIPSELECLRMIVALNSLLAMGLMDARRATAIRSGLAEILRFHRGRTSRPATAAMNEADLKALLGADRRLLDLFTPLLSEEDLDWLLNHAAEADNHGEA